MRVRLNSIQDFALIGNRLTSKQSNQFPNLFSVQYLEQIDFITETNSHHSSEKTQETHML